MIKKTPKSKKTKKKKADNGLDDGELWGHVATSVEPLEARHKNLLSANTGAAKKTTRPATSKQKAARGADIVPTEPPTTRRRPVLPELDHGSSPGVDKSTATRLKKGRQPIEGRLDLHGMTQAEAHPALDSFVENAYRSGKRAVLVITGKGTRADGSIGVLRQAVPRWLNQAPNRARILAFSHATAKDGGEGALYVLIKRKR